MPIKIDFPEPQFTWVSNAVINDKTVSNNAFRVVVWIRYLRDKAQHQGQRITISDRQISDVAKVEYEGPEHKALMKELDILKESGKLGNGTP